jgi:hypothetical protein
MYSRWHILCDVMKRHMSGRIDCNDGRRGYKFNYLPGSKNISLFTALKVITAFFIYMTFTVSEHIIKPMIDTDHKIEPYVIIMFMHLSNCVIINSS